MASVDGAPLLFADLTLADFKTHYYRQRPLLVRGGASAILGRLYSAEDFAQWRARMTQHYPKYVLDAGAMVAVLRAQVVVPELERVASRFTAEFPGVVAAFDTFCTGAEHGGSVGAHFDDNDNFILQQTGKKRWKIARPCFVHPASAHARAVRGERLGQVIMADEQLELELGPGDALYIPSFWIHWGIGLGQSLSVSLALNPVDTAGLLRESEIEPRVAVYLARPPRPGAAESDPSKGLAALAEWTTRPTTDRQQALTIAGIDLAKVLEGASRTALAGLLESLRCLERQPIEPSIAAAFVRSLATLAELEGEQAPALLASTCFQLLLERASEAITFADTYRLEELGQLFVALSRRVRREGGQLDFAGLLSELEDALVAHELAGASVTAAQWDHVAALDPALAALGRRYVPVLARIPEAADERSQRSMALRLGAPLPAHAPLLPGAPEAAVYALGYRAGRRLTRLLPAFWGALADHALPSLARDELWLVADFCHVFGLATARRWAVARGDEEAARRLAAEEGVTAGHLLADPRLTEIAGALLRRLLEAEHAATTRPSATQAAPQPRCHG